MRQFILIVVGLACAVTLLPAAPAGATVTALTPTDDAFTHNGDNNNYGADTSIRVKWDDHNSDHMRIGYIKFDLSAYQGVDLVSASLDLTAHPNNAGGSRTLRLWGLDPDEPGHNWTESTITGANRPASAYFSTDVGIGGHNYHWVDEAETYGDQALLTHRMTDLGTANQLVTLGADDATFLAFLNVAKERNGGAVTFILHKDGYNGSIWGHFHSKEHASNTGPVLHVTAVPEPSTFILLAIGAFGLAAYARRRRK